jgi:hypothetical protein
MGILKDTATDLEELCADFVRVFKNDDPKKKLEETVDLLRKLTSDDSSEDVQLRALMVYLAIVKHTKSGGTVKFVGQGPDRTLKVRLRQD